MSKVALKTSRQRTISLYLQTSKMYHSRMHMFAGQNPHPSKETRHCSHSIWLLELCFSRVWEKIFLLKWKRIQIPFFFLIEFILFDMIWKHKKTKDLCDQVSNWVHKNRADLLRREKNSLHCITRWQLNFCSLGLESTYLNKIANFFKLLYIMNLPKKR